jgi:hypothetical protein
MRLRIVTPTLGASRWLDDTVASVRAATPAGAAEHLLVAPAAQVAPLAQRFPACRVIAEPAGTASMYAAINAGLAAPGDWDAFTYLNDDDLLLPAFAAVRQALERDAGANAHASAGGRAAPLLAYGGVRLIDAAGRRVGAIPIAPQPAAARLLYAQRLEPVYQHGTLVTRAAVAAIGGFDASFRYCGDSEFLARACVRGVRFVRATRAEVAAFRLRAGQLTKNRGALEAERRRVDEQLGLLAPRLTPAHRWARLRFRLANLPIYAERVRRHGFVSFDELLARCG